MTAPDQPDLRQQLADALNAEPRFAFQEVLDTVLAVVQPVLDAKDAEIAELADRLSRTHIELGHWRTVITRELRDERDRQRKRAEAAEAEIARLHREYGGLAEQAQQIGDQR